MVGGGGGDPFYLKLRLPNIFNRVASMQDGLCHDPTGPRWSKIADFEPIIARSTLAVTPSEKSSINANRKSTTRIPMSLR